jgi:uncharacterized protein with PIN domain
MGRYPIHSIAAMD